MVSLSSNGADGQGGTDDDITHTNRHVNIMQDSEISDDRKLKALGATPEYTEAAKRIQLNGDKATNPHANIAWKRRSPKPTSGPVKSARSVVKSARFMRYAETLVATHDKNKDGVLDLEESKDVKFLKPEYDSNTDGKLTPEEIAKGLAAK